MGSVKLIGLSAQFEGASAFQAEAVPKSREWFEIAAAVVERGADLIAVMAAVMLANLARELLQVKGQVHYSVQTVIITAFGFSVLFVLMLDHNDVHRRSNSLLRIRETERVLRATMRTFGLACPIVFFLQPFLRWAVLSAMVFVPLLVIAEKQLVFALVRHLHGHGYGLRNVLVYGAGGTGRGVFSAIIRSPKLGLNPVAILDDNERLAGDVVYEFGYNRERSARVIAGPLTADLLREMSISLVVVGIPSFLPQRLKEVETEARIAGVKVAFVPKLSYNSESSTDYVDIDGVLIASMGLPERKWLYTLVKQTFDFGLSSVLLILTLPLWTIVAALIRFDSKGSALFRQMRVGHRGIPFELYKFRTMRMDASRYGLHPTSSEDPRLTRVGRWLRRTSLDELPQLINVLKGDMSLVGPRPEMPFIVADYEEHHRQRLQVIPGLTGLWQLSADRACMIHENVQYDLYYIRNRNFFMDLAILLHTAVFAMKGI